MTLPALARTEIAGDVAAAVARVPAGPGVGQLLGPEGRSLVIGPASSLRRWAASNLGMGKPPAPGRRPKTNLAPVATALAWVETDGPFLQRLVFERLMAPLVPLASRRDLKPPAFLLLDEAERFPRVALRARDADRAKLFGPFRDRRAAERARDLVRWGPVIAGLFAALATLASLTVLGLAIGLSSYTAGDQASSFGIGAGIWGAISALIASVP